MHHVGVLYGQFMMHGQRNIKLWVVYVRDSEKFRLTNVIPERIIFVSRGITVTEKWQVVCVCVCVCVCVQCAVQYEPPAAYAAPHYTVSTTVWPVVGLATRRHRFERRHVYDSRLCPVSIILPILHTHSSLPTPCNVSS